MALMGMRTIILAAALALAACSASSSDTPPPEASAPAAGGGPVAGAEARRLVAQGALLLDVRTAGEFSAGHVDGALNVPFDEVAARLAELGPPSRPIVAYCHSGRRSGIAATTLRARGYTVWDLGPMTAW